MEIYREREREGCTANVLCNNNATQVGKKSKTDFVVCIRNAGILSIQNCDLNKLLSTFERYNKNFNGI